MPRLSLAKATLRLILDTMEGDQEIDVLKARGCAYGLLFFYDAIPEGEQHYFGRECRSVRNAVGHLSDAGYMGEGFWKFLAAEIPLYLKILASLLRGESPESVAELNWPTVVVIPDRDELSRLSLIGDLLESLSQPAAVGQTRSVLEQMGVLLDLLRLGELPCTSSKDSDGHLRSAVNMPILTSVAPELMALLEQFISIRDALAHPFQALSELAVDDLDLEYVINALYQNFYIDRAMPLITAMKHEVKVCLQQKILNNQIEQGTCENDKVFDALVTETRISKLVKKQARKVFLGNFSSMMKARCDAIYQSVVYQYLLREEDSEALTLFKDIDRALNELATEKNPDRFVTKMYRIRQQLFDSYSAMITTAFHRILLKQKNNASQTGELHRQIWQACTVEMLKRYQHDGKQSHPLQIACILGASEEVFEFIFKNDRGASTVLLDVKTDCMAGLISASIEADELLESPFFIVWKLMKNKEAFFVKAVEVLVTDDGNFALFSELMSQTNTRSLKASCFSLQELIAVPIKVPLLAYLLASQCDPNFIVQALESASMRSTLEEMSVISHYEGIVGKTYSILHMAVDGFLLRLHCAEDFTEETMGRLVERYQTIFALLLQHCPADVDRVVKLKYKGNIYPFTPLTWLMYQYGRVNKALPVSAPIKTFLFHLISLESIRLCYDDQLITSPFYLACGSGDLDLVREIMKISRSRGELQQLMSEYVPETKDIVRVGNLRRLKNRGKFFEFMRDGQDLFKLDASNGFGAKLQTVCSPEEKAAMKELKSEVKGLRVSSEQYRNKTIFKSPIDFLNRMTTSEGRNHVRYLLYPLLYDLSEEACNEGYLTDLSALLADVNNDQVAVADGNELPENNGAVVTVCGAKTI